MNVSDTLSTFGLGLEVTALGMGLVFLTLIIVALVIWGLDRIFRPKPEEPEEGEADEEPETPIAAAEVAASGGANEAAAIAVALALALRELQPRMMASSRAAPVGQGPFVAPVDDETVLGEVVLVNYMNPGADVWKAQGRVASTI